MGKPQRDTLGDRMKTAYENRARHYFPRRTYTLVRVDGMAFHTFTKGLAKPYDKDFMSCMDAAAVALCQKASNVRFAFVQSDEISFVMTDFDTPETEAWFDGNQSKIESASAAIATAAFNRGVMQFNRQALELTYDGELGHKKAPIAAFDGRAWTVPDYIEVENYFVWRQQDAARNSVTLLASAYASHKQLHGKNGEQRLEIIKAAGDNWSKHPARFRHGAIIRRSGADEWGKNLSPQPSDECYRVGNWFVDPKTPTFTRERKYLRSLIPRHWEGDEGAKK